VQLRPDPPSPCTYSAGSASGFVAGVRRTKVVLPSTWTSSPGHGGTTAGGAGRSGRSVSGARRARFTRAILLRRRPIDPMSPDSSGASDFASEALLARSPANCLAQAASSDSSRRFNAARVARDRLLRIVTDDRRPRQLLVEAVIGEHQDDDRHLDHA